MYSQPSWKTAPSTTRILLPSSSLQKGNHDYCFCRLTPTSPLCLGSAKCDPSPPGCSHSHLLWDDSSPFSAPRAHLEVGAALAAGSQDTHSLLSFSISAEGACTWLAGNKERTRSQRCTSAHDTTLCIDVVLLLLLEHAVFHKSLTWGGTCMGCSWCHQAVAAPAHPSSMKPESKFSCYQPRQRSGT